MIIDRTFVDSFVKTTERGAYGASTFKGKNESDKLSEMLIFLAPRVID